MSDIRPCTPEDIPAIAAIFQKSFRNRSVPAPKSLERCLSEILFYHPWRDPELPSRVFTAPDGSVGGYIGVVPLRMSFRGRKVRAAVPTSLAVADPQKYPLAGARLVRSFLSGPQDLSISEPANALSQGLWARLGGHVVPSESMEWLRVLHPAGLALAMLGERWSAKLTAPVFHLADRVAHKLVGHVLSVDTAPRSYQHDEDVSDEILLQHLPQLAGSYTLHPEWDPGAFGFMLAHAAQNRARGTLFRRLVYGKGMKPIGCYVYHGRPGRVAWVLQVIAREGSLDAVLDSLFAHAALNGAVAIKGRTELRLLDPLLRRGAFFFRRHSAMVHSRHPELIDAVRAGGAITGGLAGESWMRLCADRFT